MLVVTTNFSVLVRPVCPVAYDCKSLPQFCLFMFVLCLSPQSHGCEDVYRMHGALQFIVVSLKEGMFNNANVIFRTKFVDGVSTVTRTVPAAAAGGSQAVGRGRDKEAGGVTPHR